MESVRPGAVVALFFLVIAIGWLVRQYHRMNEARAQADAAHLRTIESLVPLVRDIAPTLTALSRRLEAHDVMVRAEIAEARGARGRRWTWW
jgi:hypothetical protein